MSIITEPIEKEVIFDNFSDGMWTNIDEPEKPKTGFKMLKNARIDNTEGMCVKRLPATKYNGTSLGDEPIKSGVRYYYGTDDKELIIFYETAVKKGDDGAGTFSNLDTGYTTNSTFDWVIYKDRLYWCNGNEQSRRYDGTNVRDWGCPASNTTPSLSSTASGDLTGDYFYKVTFVYDGYQESNPSNASTTVSYSSAQGIITIPVSPDSVCTGRKLYRTKDGGSAYYLAKTISDNTSTTVSDNVADASLGDQLEENHDEPYAYHKQMLLHQDRIFGLRPNSCRIDYTKIDNYVSYPDIYDEDEDYEMIAEDDGENVETIIAIDEGIICFKRSRTYILRTYQNDPNQWSIDLIDDHGTCSWRSPVKTKYGIMYLEMDRYRQKDLRLLTATSYGASESIGWKIKDQLNSISNQELEDVVCSPDGNRIYISYCDDTGIGYNNKQLVLQFAGSPTKYGYTVDDLHIACYIPARGSGDEGQMYAGLSDEGSVVRLDTPTQDLVHYTSGDINTGTLTRLEESGTEEYPEIKLSSTESDWEGTFAHTPLESLTASLASYTEFMNYHGYIQSDVLYIGATTLESALWTVSLSDYGYSRFRIRTGATAEACQTASWSDFFSDPDGSDISAVSANDYIQYELYLLSSQAFIDTVSKIYRGEFIVKISAGLGTEYEAYISFLIRTGKLDLGFRGYIKRLKYIVVEYASTAGQTVRFYLKKNEDASFGDPSFSIDTDENPYIYEKILPFNYVGEYFDWQITEQSISPFKVKSVRVGFIVLPKKTYNLRR